MMSRFISLRVSKTTTSSRKQVASKDCLPKIKKLRVAGVDADGVLRGKIMSKEKFLSSISTGFGMSSAIFAWDIHDVLFTTKTEIARGEDGFADFIAYLDLASFRRLPTEDNIPFFLLRRPLRTAMGPPKQDRILAAFLENNTPGALRPLTGGKFGYSSARPIVSKRYFHDIFDHSGRAGCALEGWHTESGPGVFEAVGPIDEMADSVSVFKLVTKSLGIEHGVTPCFLAKPVQGLPGNSGHIHISLTDLAGNNIFARPGPPDPDAEWADIAQVSDVGRHFLAGHLDSSAGHHASLCRRSSTPISASWRTIGRPWASAGVSRIALASVRLIAPPVCKASATRFEVRIPGADLYPHYALAAIVAAGWRGVEEKLAIPVPPAKIQRKEVEPELLPNSLLEATTRFKAPESLARKILGDEFVDFYAATREHELRIWREAVTDW
ncbi:glutamine synthetase [Colletotrichum salicis]|uniref:Glutamine synthetase n=1 Tax=Colletotrichum salicis TaxID=1209931 RepID=A0A135RV78_9PEZI|nr:glutamine synthetase [Colletotrichum salicis]